MSEALHALLGAVWESFASGVKGRTKKRRIFLLTCLSFCISHFTLHAALYSSLPAGTRSSLYKYAMRSPKSPRRRSSRRRKPSTTPHGTVSPRFNSPSKSSQQWNDLHTCSPSRTTPTKRRKKRPPPLDLSSVSSHSSLGSIKVAHRARLESVVGSRPIKKKPSFLNLLKKEDKQDEAMEVLDDDRRGSEEPLGAEIRKRMGTAQVTNTPRQQRGLAVVRGILRSVRSLSNLRGQ